MELDAVPLESSLLRLMSAPNTTPKRKQKTPFAEFVGQVSWIVACILTLGYARKYYRRVLAWRVYDPSKDKENYRAYSVDINSRLLKLKTSVRAKQQKEYDRLIMPLSVITATSAAALAIPSPFGNDNNDKIHWLATAFYGGAFGLSLEGIIIITYLTVFAAGTSAETMGRMANGKDFLKGAVGPVAVITALPTAITTYSSLFLLAGLLVMTIAADKESNIQDHTVAFKAIVLIPVCLMLLCLVVTVVGCEVFTRSEIKGKKEGMQNGEMGGNRNEDEDEDGEKNGPVLATGVAILTEEPGTGARVSFAREQV